MGVAESRKKVGLALSSGAARGAAHVGVLEVLEEEGIPIDMIAGTSAGALIGALYARCRSAAEVGKIVANLASKRFTIFTDLTIPKTGLIRGKRLKDQLKSIIGDITFEDLGIPFACVATDIGNGGEVVIKHGSVVDAVRASISIPGMFSLVKWNGRYLVDGGLVNPVPVRLLKEMGADFVIAVNVVPDMRHRVYHPDKEHSKHIDETKEPNIFNVLMRTIHIAAYQAVRASLEGADVVIEPDVAHVGFGEFGRVAECVFQGKLAAESAIPEIKRQLAAQF